MSDQAAIRPMSNVQFVPRPWILYPSPVHVAASVGGQVFLPLPFPLSLFLSLSLPL